MDVLPSQVDPASEAYRANRAHHEALLSELRAHLAEVRLGGGENAQ